MTGSASSSGVPGELVHGFDADHGDRTAEELHRLLGRKGATLAALWRMGAPVPPGFTLTTEAWRRHRRHGWDDVLQRALDAGLADLEARTGARLGDPEAPLLVSVRGGAATSMPGMLETVLDVGCTPAVADGLRRAGADAAFVADTCERAARAWADVVGGEAPGDARAQVLRAVEAVFASWDAERVRRYREIEGIADDVGTAVTVQVMVFGNRSERSASGVAFTRDPSTGAPGLMGDVLVGAQGDDVVAGRRPTLPLAALATRWPRIWAELDGLGRRLEHQLRDAVDIEFTVDDGRFWVLQARPAKRGPLAAARIAVDQADDPAFPLSRAEAVARCRHLLGDDAPWAGTATEVADADVVATGLAAAPGRAVGVLCTDLDAALRLGDAGADVVLVRPETSPADVPAIAASVGLVTASGGLVSHAAVVARSWGLPAVVGAAELRLLDGGVVGPGGAVSAGEVVTVDGDAGRLLRGAHPAPPGGPPPEVEVLRRWAEEA